MEERGEGDRGECEPCPSYSSVWPLLAAPTSGGRAITGLPVARPAAWFIVIKSRAWNKVSLPSPAPPLEGGIVPRKRLAMGVAEAVGTANSLRSDAVIKVGGDDDGNVGTASGGAMAAATANRVDLDALDAERMSSAMILACACATSSAAVGAPTILLAAAMCA